MRTLVGVLVLLVLSGCATKVQPRPYLPGGSAFFDCNTSVIGCKQPLKTGPARH